MRMVVVLPAPLAPTKPTTRPWSMEKETPSTARSWPKWRWRFSTRMAGSDMIGEGSGDRAAEDDVIAFPADRGERVDETGARV